MSKQLITINCITYYKNCYCHCGCNKRISYPITKSGLNAHKHRGIPKYIKGHATKINGFQKGHKLSCGKNNPMYGKHHTIKTRKLLSLIRIGIHPKNEFKCGKLHPNQNGKNNPRYIDGYAHKRSSVKQSSIKRNLGYIALNDPFKVSSFHHIDNEKGIWIPLKLHKSFYHSVKSGKNLEKMNDLAFEYMFEQYDLV
jgi:hypothetical protein